MSMVKTHKDSKIIQFHSASGYGQKLLDGNSSEIVLQIEAVDHKVYDFIAEIIDRNKYNQEA